MKTKTIIAILTLTLAACTPAFPLSTFTATQTPTPSKIPSPDNTITQTATATVLAACTPMPDGYINVIDRSTYVDVDAGLELGARGAIGILQQALEAHHPNWAQEEGFAEYVWDVSGTQKIGVNPRVLLVTAGVSLDWQIPEGHYLQKNVSLVGVTLTQHYREFRFDEDLQAKYSQISNASNYALYAFFDFDLEKLETWGQEYDRMFGDIQPRIASEDCRPVMLTETPSP